ncbi:lovastatin nonaketide synthase, partial [Colletotrichum incanum]
LDKANVARDMTHTPLFQVAMNYRQGNFSGIPLGGCKLRVREGFDAKSPYDMAFSVTPTEDTSYLQIVGREDLYGQDEMDFLLEMFATLLEDVADNTSKTLAECNIYDAKSVDRAITLGQGDIVDFDWPVSLTERIERVATANPDAIAVKDGNTALKYAQLVEKVNDLASVLVKKAHPISRVAVLCEPSVDWVVSMLAILRVGSAYIPLDTKLPNERLAAIINVSSACTVICHLSTSDRTHELSSNIPIIDISTVPRGRGVSNAERPGDTSFILFTSGSTGTPKGIELSSAGIINYTATKASKLDLGREVVLQQSSLGFDVSIAQAFKALANGGTLVIVPQDGRGDPVALVKIMKDEGVTFTLGTPTEYFMLIRHGGEEIAAQMAWRHAYWRESLR